MRGLSRIGGVLAVLLAASSLAQAPRPAVMPVPLELKGVKVADPDQERLGREFRRLLKLAGTAAPDLSRSEVAVRELSAARCDVEEACVAAFAQRTGALYALFATVERQADGAVVVTGRVVRDDGVVARPRASVTRPSGPFVDVARAALTELFRVLDVAGLPVERVIEKPVAVVVPAPVETPSPPSPPPVVPVPPAPRGVGLLVAGGATALAGLVTLAVTSIPALSVRGTGSPRIAATVDEASALFVGYVGSIVGFALVGVGTVVGAIGGVLWATSAEPRVNVAPLPGGALVSWEGTW